MGHFLCGQYRCCHHTPWNSPPWALINRNKGSYPLLANLPSLVCWHTELLQSQLIHPFCQHLVFMCMCVCVHVCVCVQPASEVDTGDVAPWNATCVSWQPASENEKASCTRNRRKGQEGNRKWRRRLHFRSNESFWPEQRLQYNHSVFSRFGRPGPYHFTLPQSKDLL